MIRIALGFLFGVLAFARASDSSLVRLFGSEEALLAVSNPDSVEICALAHEWKKRPAGEIGLDSVYRESSSYLTLRESDIEVLSGLLSSRSSYDFEEAKDCIPEHNVRARFRKGEVQVTIEFCFGCDILEVTSATEDCGEFWDCHLEDFDAVSEELFAFARRQFPDDPTLLKLEELRERWKKRREERANQSVETTPVSAPH